jgi:hypothetical protein
VSAQAHALGHASDGDVRRWQPDKHQMD